MSKEYHCIAAQVTKGRNLAAKDVNGKSDPYYIVSWVGGSGARNEPIKGPTITKTLNPDWAAKAAKKKLNCILEHKPVSMDNIASLKIEVWDYDKVGSDDFMGTVTVPFSATKLKHRINTQFDMWVPLKQRENKKNEEVKGDVCISVKYMKSTGLSRATLDRKGSLSFSSSAAVLKVRVMRGRNLKAMDVGGKSDPFYIARWVITDPKAQCSEPVKSTVVSKTLNPNWYAHWNKKNQELPALEQRPSNLTTIAPLEVEVFDKDSIGSAEFMGRVIIPFDPLELKANDGQTYYKWIPLMDKMQRINKRSSSNLLQAMDEQNEAKDMGKICVEVNFLSSRQKAARQEKEHERDTFAAKVGLNLAKVQLTHETHPLCLALQFDEELEASLFKTLSTKVETNSWNRRMQTHANSFLGSDAVDLLVMELSSNECLNYDSLFELLQKKMKNWIAPDIRDAATIRLLTAKHAGWNREDATLLMFHFLLNGRIRRVGTSTPNEFADSNSLYKFENPGAFELAKMMKNTKTKSIGSCFKKAGNKPKFPVVLVPGLASSALEVWESEMNPDWVGERVWIDPFKIGNLATVKKIGKLFSLGSKKKSQKIEEQASGDESVGRPWLKHLMPQPDGWSDPPGIRVRPCTGLGAIDYLSHIKGPPKQQSYVWSFIIDAFIEVGYDRANLIAAPYDWRIPPEKIEERDGHFTSLKAKIEVAAKVNKEKVVVIGHSMGNRNIQYFLRWVEKEAGKEWIDKNIHAYMALGAPFLGAPKVIRSLLTGDALGLDMFLVMSESLQLAKRLGSLPWLLPVNHPKFTQELCWVLKDEKMDANNELKYANPHAFDTIQKYAPQAWQTFESFYKDDEFHLAGATDYGSCHGKSYNGTDALILAPPPIPRLWCIYGINLDTETAYYLKDKGDSMKADSSADKLSEKTTASNPAGLKISNGVGFETSNTKQPILNDRQCSGDATLPYASMAYAREWRKSGLDVDIIEVDGAEHREMMSDKTVIFHILKYCTEGENPYAQIDRDLYG